MKKLRYYRLKLEYWATPFFANKWIVRLISILWFISIFTYGWKTAMGFVLYTSSMANLTCLWNNAKLTLVINEYGWQTAWFVMMALPILEALFLSYTLYKYLRWAAKHEGLHG